MENSNLIPIGSYKLKIAGIILLVVSLLYELLILIHLIQVDPYFSAICNWLVVASLSLVNFSKSKYENKKTMMVRLYSLKIGGIFISSFLLGIELVALLKKETIEVPGILTGFLFNSIVFISYFINIYFNKNSFEEYTEVTVSENIKPNIKLYIP